MKYVRPLIAFTLTGLMFLTIAFTPLAFDRPQAVQTVVTATPTSSSDPVLVGAGDIARCDDGVAASSQAELTARLIETIPGTVFTAGDNVYPDGAAEEFATCYDPTWGRFKDRTRPSAGNHDYHTDDGGPYYAYFGENAGPAGQGYYSYDLGAWHIVVLNSNLDGKTNQEQRAWLTEDLADSSAVCTLAIWHHPLFSSGEHGNDDYSWPLWQILYEAGADVVINGHDHTYERFAPQDMNGEADPERGIRQFVAGTGGAPLYDFDNYDPNGNSEVRDNSTFGVLKLTLRPDSYDWEFVPVEEGGFTDAGSGECHR
jgi:acid phosphatase type 7